MIVTAKALLTVTIALTAGLSPDAVERCARIDDTAQRLGCYERLAGAGKTPPGAAATRRGPAPQAAPASGPRTPRPAPPVRNDAEPVSAEALFGFDEPRGAQRLRVIRSRYDGEFRGWNGRTLFRLENGQVWRQAEDGRVAFSSSRPMVTISNGTLGTYRLRVDGLNRAVRVTRVR